MAFQTRTPGSGKSGKTLPNEAVGGLSSGPDISSFGLKINPQVSLLGRRGNPVQGHTSLEAGPSPVLPSPPAERALLRTLPHAKGRVPEACWEGPPSSLHS